MKKPLQGPARPALFLCLIAVVLLGLHFVPAFSIGDYEVKPVDLLSDVVSEPGTDGSGIVVPKSAETLRKEAEVRRDTCPPGLTCIEDYSTDGRGMAPFYAALADRGRLNRPVRIAYFGDSFIEADILTADLRAMLQNRYGGCGVGFVDIASPFTKLRSSVTHKSSGWTDHSVLEKAGCDKRLLGISGRYAIAGPGATISYGGVREYAHLDSFEVATLYATGTAPLNVTAAANGGSARTLSNGGNSQVRTATLIQHMGRVDFMLHSNTTAFGVALEGTRGVTVDNFSLRGSSGLPLASIPDGHLSQLYAVRPYDLIVLQFGLNVASKNQLKYDTYIHGMRKVIDRFRRLFPGAGILVVGIGDREDRGTNGTLRTMPAVKALMGYQQAMAAEAGVAYWNLYQAMGGEGAIRRMADAKPAEAGKDYTHINHRGGKRVATMLYRALVFGYGQYLKSN